MQEELQYSLCTDSNILELKEGISVNEFQQYGFLVMLEHKFQSLLEMQ